MEKIKDWFRENNGLKLLSVVIAFIVWLSIVNVSNPEVRNTVTVNLEIRNADELEAAGKTYSFDDESVRVSYRIRTAERSRVSAKDFNAYVDLSDYSVTGAVPVYLELSSTAEALVTGTSVDPVVIHVNAEDIQEKEFEINVRLNGNIADGYIAAEPELTRKTLIVSGPVSSIGSISSVGIEVNVSGRNEDADGIGNIIFYDANNNRMNIDSRISYDRSIQYHIPVYPVKSYSINAKTMGTPQEGYVLESVEINPTFISVYGPEEELKKYSSVDIPSELLDITGATENINMSVDISSAIPEGIHLVQPGSEVAVIIRIREVVETTVVIRQEGRPDGAAGRGGQPQSADVRNNESEGQNADGQGGSTENQTVHSGEASAQQGSGNAEHDTAAAETVASGAASGISETQEHKDISEKQEETSSVDNNVVIDPASAGNGPENAHSASASVQDAPSEASGGTVEIANAPLETVQ